VAGLDKNTEMRFRERCFALSKTSRARQEWLNAYGLSMRSEVEIIGKLRQNISWFGMMGIGLEEAGEGVDRGEAD
jgi:hypothetical protein